jgi:putative redox protein
MSDKSKELSSSIKLINDRLNFSGMVEGNSPISIDYIPPMGDNLGYTSLQLLLLSLSSCVASAILIFLRRMQKTISDFEITAKGIRIISTFPLIIDQQQIKIKKIVDLE